MHSARIALLLSVFASFVFAGTLPDNPVPEPSTWLMIGTAGLAFWL
ncbi:MAG: PEP-CTERM sorting domain-containing protein [Acidobacteriota bacterium]|jgi:hypothetical protein